MKSMKYFSVLILFAFMFNANASIHLVHKQPPRSPATHVMLPPGHAWPPCGACKKQTKGPGKDTPCEVAKGYTCHPGLQKDSNGQWHIAPPPGHHPGHMGPPPPCKKCGQPCPPPHIHKKCSKGGECRPQMPPFGHRPGHMAPPPIPHAQSHK